jgi:integrase
MPGHVIEIIKNKRYKIVAEAGKDPKTGKRKRVVRYHNGRKSQAEHILALLIADLEREAYVDIDKITVASWMDQWLEEYKKPALRPRTYELYEYYSDHFIKPDVGQVPLQKLRPEQLQKLYNSHLDKSSRVVHQIHQLLNGALKQAVKNRLINHNPADATTRPPLKYKEARFMTKEEQDKLLAALADHPRGAAFATMLGTGLRRGELLGLHWEDIDSAIDAYIQQTEAEKELWQLEQKAKKTKKKDEILARMKALHGQIMKLKEERTIFVKRGIVSTKERGVIAEEPKTKKSRRTVPLPKMVAEFLLWHRDKARSDGTYRKDGPVFPSKKGTYIWPRNFSRSFEELRAKLDLKDITPHGLRHTFASRLLELREDMKVIQELLGHSKMSTTADIYAHVVEKMKRQAVSKLDDVMGTVDKKIEPPAPNGHQKTLRRIK